MTASRLRESAVEMTPHKTLCARVAALVVATAAVACSNGVEPTKSGFAPAKHAAFPRIVNQGGPILTPLRLVVIIAANDPLRDSLTAFATAMASSHWWQQVAAPYGIAQTATSASVIGPPIASGTSLAPAAVVNYVQAAAIDSAGYQHDGRTTYMMFLPAGVAYASDSLCQGYLALHVPFANDGLAIVQRCQSHFHSMFDAMTSFASHELIEAASDPLWNAWRLTSPFLPWNGSAWALDDGGVFEEAADFCETTEYHEGGYLYQRSFSNDAVAAGGDPCVPAIAPGYYNVTTDQDWYTATAGVATIPFTAWSTDSVADWVVLAASGPRTQSLAAPTVVLSCADSTTINGVGYCRMNNGKSGTVRVTLPAGTGSKSYFTVRVFSLRVGSDGQRPPQGEDYHHYWMVGVYVP